MAQQQREVRDAQGFIIGWCRSYDDNEVFAISFKQGVVGRYVKAMNITFDMKGNKYAFGDATSDLVREAARE